MQKIEERHVSNSKPYDPESPSFGNLDEVKVALMWITDEIYLQKQQLKNAEITDAEKENILSNIAKLKEEKKAIHNAATEQNVQGYTSRAEKKQAKQKAKKDKQKHRKKNMPKKMGKKMEHVYLRVDMIYNQMQQLTSMMKKIDKHVMSKSPELAAIKPAGIPGGEAFKPYLQPVY